MEYLSREQILNAQDLQSEDVAVPEWGGTVKVIGLSGTQRDAFEESLLEGKGRNRQARLANIRAKLVAQSIVDEKGQRVFSDGDVAALGRKSAAALDRVFAVSQRLSGISEEDVEELAADLSATPGGEPFSNSQPDSE